MNKDAIAPYRGVGGVIREATAASELKYERRYTNIEGVTYEGLRNYSPEEYDAVKQSDGTFTLVPLLWTNQREYIDYAFGCGDWDD